MKSITLFFILIVVSSCDSTQKSKKQSVNLELSKDTENYYQRVTEYTYDGCEYIKVGYGKSIWGSHKGNFKNPIHNTK